MSNLSGTQSHEKPIRASLTVIGIVALMIALALTTRRSGMPVLFGRFSFELFVIILALLLFSISVGIIAVRAPIRFASRLLYSGIGLLIAIVLLDVSAYLLAPVLPYRVWGQMPYQVKKMTYASRPEAVRLQQELVLEQDYWAFEPFKCTDWPIMSGPDLRDVKLLPTYEVCHDEIGFRNPRGTYEENARVDVLMLGDSMTYGYGSRRDWPDYFRERTGLIVLNMAQVGGSVPEWIGAFEKYGAAKSPSVVIATTADSNDFFGLERLAIVVQSSESQLEFIMGVKPNDYGANPLYRLADYSLMLSMGTRSIKFFTAGNEILADNSTSMTLSLPDEESDIQLWTNRRPDLADNETWALYEQGVVELATQVQQAGSVLILVYFTTASVIYAPYDLNPAATVLADVENNSLISEKLANISSEYDIFYLDTTPILQEMAATSPLLYAWDGHFTQEGHDAVAEIIHDYFRDRNLLKANR